MAKFTTRLSIAPLAAMSILASAACGGEQSGVADPAQVIAEAATSDASDVAASDNTPLSNEARLAFAQTLFTGAEQYENFARLATFSPTRTMAPSPKPHVFENGAPIAPPVSFEAFRKTYETTAFLDAIDNVALLALKDGKVVHEAYRLTGDVDQPWISMSMAKSFISALVGIAIADGHIDGVDTPITVYVPELAGSAYDGVAIKHVLQMSSGAEWDEDYADPESDINKLSRVFAMGGSINDVVAGLDREYEPGVYNRYNSADTQALGMLIVGATGRSIADYMGEKLWRPMGAGASAAWLTDTEGGMEMAFAGMLARARDFALIGEVYRQGGALDGKQIVPAEWVAASLTADAPHLTAGDNPQSDTSLGYGYQWWLFDGDEGDFAAMGVYNQMIYVNPTDATVLVMLSANSNYQATPNGSGDLEDEAVEFFRAYSDLIAQ
ncbi:MAG: serine hydrolase [Pseudomonadota bacterium]